MSFINHMLNESSDLNWIKVVVIDLLRLIHNLTKKISIERDTFKQNALIAQQNQLLAHLSGINIAISGNDKQLLAKLRHIRQVQ